MRHPQVKRPLHQGDIRIVRCLVKKVSMIHLDIGPEPPGEPGSMTGRTGSSGNVVRSGAVAQLARAPALQAGGRGFDSHQLHSVSPVHVGSPAVMWVLGPSVATNLRAEGAPRPLGSAGRTIAWVTGELTVMGPAPVTALATLASISRHLERCQSPVEWASLLRR